MLTLFGNNIDLIERLGTRSKGEVDNRPSPAPKLCQLLSSSEGMITNGLNNKYTELWC